MKHEKLLLKDLTDKLVKMGFNWCEYYVCHNITDPWTWEIPIYIAIKWLWETHNILVGLNMNIDNGDVYAVVCREHYNRISTYASNNTDEVSIEGIRIALDILEGQYE